MLLMMSGILCDLQGDFRHYIGHDSRAAGQAQPEVGEQLGGGRTSVDAFQVKPCS